MYQNAVNRAEKPFCAQRLRNGQICCYLRTSFCYDAKLTKHVGQIASYSLQNAFQVLAANSYVEFNCSMGFGEMRPSWALMEVY